MTLAELRAKRKRLDEELAALLEGEEFDAQRAKDLGEQIEGLDVQIEMREKREQAEARAKESAGRQVPPHEVPEDRNGPEIEVGENRVAQDPNKGFKSPREFFHAVIEVSRGRRVAEERHRDGLKILEQRTAGSDEQGGYADPYGGYLVPEGFTPNLLKIDPEEDPIGGRITKIPMATTTVKLPARVDKTRTSSVSGGLTVGRSAEAVAKTASRMEFSGVTLTAHSLFGLTYASVEILTDSPISFAALLAAGFSDEFSSTIVDERLGGTGVGQFLGVNNSPALISVTKETGQDADTIVFENVVKMRARCWGYKNAVWMANHDTIPQLATMNAAIGTGGQLVWIASTQPDIPDMLFGRPIIFTDSCETVGDAGDIILCNWTQYLEGVYQPLQSAESVHVRFVEHERAFKFWIRNAGAPWWNTYLTPKKGSTLSPFVRLAARA